MNETKQLIRGVGGAFNFGPYAERYGKGMCVVFLCFILLISARDMRTLEY